MTNQTHANSHLLNKVIPVPVIPPSIKWDVYTHTKIKKRDGTIVLVPKLQIHYSKDNQ
jgi:hypothetical protein